MARYRRFKADSTKGYEAAISVVNGRHFKISDLELTADAGTVNETAAK
jgi:hypothetical protein